ncbi:binding-protein-dependent transport systems inner membrane component (plasmid) [Haloterrigena turkmenica DSM 5511]|uniref:Binding-protein-dependent transport systems inner membrane component n=2 Tax=Haloterrigena turkmenica TaxID=62320 RepID=D2S239_HALTV|nr:binding-protein-dependent transport systems inner membrane component [Haloterrigena turkmenica DSM 5511]
MTVKKDRLSSYRNQFVSLSTETWLGWGLLLPAGLLMGVIIFYPIVDGILTSFQMRSFLQPEAREFVFLAHYRALIQDGVFWTALWNSAVLTGVSVALQFLLGLGLALLLKQRVPGITIFRSITMVTWVLPVIVIVIVFNWLVQPGYGLVNLILAEFGLPTDYWFSNTTWAMPLIILMHVWKNAPFFAIALFAAMQSIPDELYEAAEMDGASAIQQFRYITLPNISYVAMIMIVLHVLYTFNNFDFVWLSTGGGPLRTTEVLPTYVYKQAFDQYLLGYAASIGVVMLIIMMMFTVIYVKLEDLD